MRYSLFIGLLLLIFCAPLCAQISNIESQRIKRDSIGWYREINTGIRFVREVNNVYTLHNDVRVQYKTEKNLYLGLAEYNWSGGAGRVLNHNAFLHLRYNRSLPREDIKMEAFNQIQFNQITRINVRWLLGVGPRFTIAEKDKIVCNIGTAYMFEILRERDQENNPIRMIENRSSSYMSLSVFPQEHIALISTTYFQPRLDDMLDYRLTNVTEFRVKVTKLLTLGITYRLSLDTSPAPGIPGLNHFFDNRIGIVF